MKPWRPILLTGLLCLWMFLMPAGAFGEGISRMLLVGCDHFLTQEDTAPSSRNNVEQMEAVLSAGSVQPARVISAPDGIPGSDALKSLILEAFQDAQEGDTSYFYISTHGLWEEAEPNASMMLLLSDGREEGGITARQLFDCLETVPGRKILIVDACHSGAMIGKGELKLSARNQFPGKVLAVEPGAVNGIVKMEVLGGNVLTSTISLNAIEELGLEPGVEAVAVIKATSVMIGR